MAPRRGRKRRQRDIDAAPPASGTREKQQKQEEELRNSVDGEDESECTTPKAERYRIPELLTCPPAPKKRRLPIAHCSPCKVPTTTPVLFFDSPDLDLFFFPSLRGMSAS